MRIIKSDVCNSHVGHVVADFLCVDSAPEHYSSYCLVGLIFSQLIHFLDICSYRQEVKLDLQLVKSALFIRMLTA